MLDFNTAALVASLVASIPILVVARTVYFALISPNRFVETDGLIEAHHHPKNDEGQPIQLRLRYSYRVFGQDYSGKRYYFGSVHECQSELLQRYPIGSRPPVYYDPDCPSRSTLQTGFQPRLWFWIALVVIVCPLLWLGMFLVMVASWPSGTVAGIDILAATQGSRYFS